MDEVVRQHFGLRNIGRVKINQAQKVVVGAGTTQFSVGEEEIFEVYYVSGTLTVRFDGGDPHTGGIPRYSDTSEVLNRNEMLGWRGTRAGDSDATVFWHSFV